MIEKILGFAVGVLIVIFSVLVGTASRWRRKANKALDDKMVAQKEAQRKEVLIDILAEGGQELAEVEKAHDERQSELAAAVVNLPKQEAKPEQDEDTEGINKAALLKAMMGWAKKWNEEEEDGAKAGAEVEGD